MLPTFALDKNLETAVFNLLERYCLEDIVETLYRYSDLQAELAKVLNQPQAVAKWDRQADALNSASEKLDEICDDEFDYLIY
jgi:hypothetical protein